MSIKPAKTAYFESRHRSEVETIKEKIESAIEQSIKSGLFSCDVAINTTTKDEIRDVVRKELQDLGYIIHIPNYESPPPGCPCDQWRYWDNITISWEN